MNYSTANVMSFEKLLIDECIKYDKEYFSDYLSFEMLFGYDDGSDYEINVYFEDDVPTICAVDIYNLHNVKNIIYFKEYIKSINMHNESNRIPAEFYINKGNLLCVRNLVPGSILNVTVTNRPDIILNDVKRLLYIIHRYKKDFDEFDTADFPDGIINNTNVIDGLQLYKNNNVESALSCFCSEYNVSPLDYYISYFIGLCYIDKLDLDSSLLYFIDVEQSLLDEADNNNDSLDIDKYFMLGVSFFAQKKWLKSYEVFYKCIDGNYNNDECIYYISVSRLYSFLSSDLMPSFVSNTNYRVALTELESINLHNHSKDNKIFIKHVIFAKIIYSMLLKDIGEIDKYKCELKEYFNEWQDIMHDVTDCIDLIKY